MLNAREKTRVQEHCRDEPVPVAVDADRGADQRPLPEHLAAGLANAPPWYTVTM